MTTHRRRELRRRAREVGLGRTLGCALVSSDMDAEGVLLRLLANGSTGTNPGLWHLADVRRALTLCGLDAGYGNPRMPWAQTREDARCQMCLAQRGGRNR